MNGQSVGLNSHTDDEKTPPGGFYCSAKSRQLIYVCYACDAPPFYISKDGTGGLVGPVSLSEPSLPALQQITEALLLRAFGVIVMNV